MISTLVIIFGIISLIALWVLALSIARAPEGNEDAAGFHVVNERPPIVRHRNRPGRPKKIRPASITVDLHLPVI